MRKRKGISNTILRWLLFSHLGQGYTRLRYPRLFDDVARFCLFIGHGRSGSSLVGALLNAHPNIVMSNELNVLDYVTKARTRNELLSLIYFTSRRQAKRGSKGGGGYTYTVIDQWQGKHQTIQVIGDRKAGATAIELFRQPDLIVKLNKLVNVPVSFVSVVRNPFDTLTTTLKKTIRLPDESEVDHLKRQIKHYFERTSAITRVCTEFGPNAVKFVYHDSLVANPRAVLTELCEFLGVGTNESYLKSCSSIIQPTVNVTRAQTHWPAELIETVNRGIAGTPWLRHYTFADN